jgi:DNA-directed RNA polymerase I subunit RPA2
VKRREQLVRHGEEGTEFGGYFVCNGIERIIRMLVVQRRHTIMAMRRKAYAKRSKMYTDAAVLIRQGGTDAAGGWDRTVCWCLT